MNQQGRFGRATWWLALPALVLLGVGEVPAQAWIAGATAGIAKQYDYEVGGTISDSDDSDIAYRAFGGYLFKPTFGVLLSWVDLGGASYEGPAFGGFTDELDADGIDLSVLGGWAPGSQDLFRLFGTVGVFWWSQDVHYTDASGVYNYDDSGSSLSIAAGGEFGLGSSAHWGVHFEWARFFDVGDQNNSGHEYDRDMVSLGFEYRFGK